ncbi:protein kinase C theta type-like [Phyllobates terribilis]|uniref:protein kinase C theta type-like n=1 Tax=Phyllobates terribilis TaxID=111132 RepID=UPI003CCAFCAE
METPMEFTVDELQSAILVSLKKIGDLAPEIRKRNKEAILNKHRNISAEINLDEDVQGTERQVSSRAKSQDTMNPQRAAAKERIRNSRDLAVQSMRHLTYAYPIINENGALCKSWSSNETISIPEFLFHLSVSSTERSVDEGEPVSIDVRVEMPPDTAVAAVEDPTDVSSLICPIRQMIDPMNPINLCHLVFHQDLGVGSFGKVILASDPDTEEMLAVKIIAKSFCDEDSITTELDILRMTVDCRFIATLRGCLESPVEYIVAMEYLVGRDLFRHLAPSNTFDMETSSDLKPQNVLIDDKGHIKISDFGLSIMNACEDDQFELDDVVGTIGYIAPEIMDKERFNHKVDSFSFGVILYVMILGKQPFYTGSTLQEYHRSLQEDVPHVPSWIPSDALDILEGLLSKTSSARYAISSCIREHPFFLSINWSDVETGEADPPFRWVKNEDQADRNQPHSGSI